MSLTQRRVTKAEEMRALAHPVRLQLLDLLGSEGSFTASEAGRRLEQSASNVSWHLRKLAAYGFVRQGDGKGRERPWTFVDQGLTFGADAEDPAVATALSDLLYESEYRVLRAKMREQDAETPQWRDATTVVQSRLWLTVDEAKMLGERLSDLLAGEDLLARNQDPSRRPAGARLMALMGWAVPYGPVPTDPAYEAPAHPLAGVETKADSDGSSTHGAHGIGTEQGSVA